MLLDPAAKKRICWFRIKLTNVSCIGAVWGGCGSLLPFTKQIKIKKNIPKVHHRRLSRVFWNTTCPLMPSLNYAPYALNTHWRQRQWARAGNHNSGVNHVIVRSASISTSMTTFRRRADFFTHSPVTWQWCQAYRKPHNHALLCFCTAMYSYMHPVFWKSNLGV